MWQKCPLCTTQIQVEHSIQKCIVCNGHKIINELTGLPPQTVAQTSTTISNFPMTYTGDFGEAVRKLNTDFRDANMESQQEYFGK